MRGTDQDHLVDPIVRWSVPRTRGCYLRFARNGSVVRTYAAVTPLAASMDALRRRRPRARH